jgi:HK97 gp10 family phage protein
MSASSSTVKWNGVAVLAKVRAATLTGVVRGTETIREEATKLMLDSPRSGRVYGRHKASGPGEPPAPDTGNLIRNIQTSVDAQKLTGNVNFGTGYSRALEYGTFKMAPRPFARPAVENKKQSIAADVAEEISGALK